MDRIRRLGLAAGLAAAIAAFPAAAYQIGSASIAKKSHDLHETFTAVARECLKDSTEAGRVRLPLDCSARFDQVKDRTAERKAQSSNHETYAARWPDDPTRMLDRDPSKIRLGLKFRQDCGPALSRGPSIDRIGLLCSSHFGPLQFLHAQATPDDRNAGDTRNKILAWASFAYRAATDRSFRETPYCDAVGALPEGGFRTALTFSDRTFCDARAGSFLWVFPKRYAAWKVGTLFALHCPNPLQENVCWERVGDYGDETARMAALGALLHLVQDSFSQAHVARIPIGARQAGPRGPFTPLVACRRPSRYYDYLAQNDETVPDDLGQFPEDPHGVADFPPKLDGSCLDPRREVDDIVTASAMILYFVEHRDERAFDDYLRTRVFPA